MKHIIEKYVTSHTIDGICGPIETRRFINHEDFPALISDLEAERDKYALEFAQWLCEWYVPCGDNEWTPNTGPHHPKTTEELLKLFTEL